MTDSGKVVDDERLKFPGTDITQLTQVFNIELPEVPWLTMYCFNIIEEKLKNFKKIVSSIPYQNA